MAQPPEVEVNQPSPKSPMPGTRMLARGTGHAISARSASLEFTETHAVPEFEQTELFTGESVPLDELMRQQGVHQPQGLAAFADPEWVDGEESDLFLAALLDDTM
jgi:hypothetical protein